MTIIFRGVCWLLAAYFFILAHFLWGYPPHWSPLGALSVALSIFLFLLPFAKSIALGNLLSFEAKVERIKDDVEAFKSETRNILNIQSSIINSVTNNVAQHTTLNLPSLSEAYSAERLMEEKSSTNDQAKHNDDRVGEYIAQSASDPSLALARLRMQLEMEFRRILNKRTELGEKTDIKFLSLRSLWQEFFKRFPEKRYLMDGLQYVNQICNAAIHGQSVPYDHAVEALSIGFRIVETLSRVKD